jgi:DNA-binding response OmpR family regulator
MTTPVSHTDLSGEEQRTEALLVLFEISDDRPDTPVKTWVIDDLITTIGRWQDNDIVLADRWISRHHAHILRREAGHGGRVRYMIKDLDSKNGLYVNGVRITELVLLEDGDRIQISPRYSLTFVDSEATAPLRQDRRGVTIDTATRQVRVMNQELVPPLSSAQFALLQALVEAPERVFSREELIPLIWPDADPAGVTDEALNSLVRRLRRRLQSIDDRYRYVIAVRGHGFTFKDPASGT